MPTAIQDNSKQNSSEREPDMYVGYKIKLSRRPVRNTVISREDILNLKIALETSNSWEEFLARV